MKGFKYRLKLNDKQKTLASKHAGAARHAYNWGVALCNEKSEAREPLPSGYTLGKLHVKDVKSTNDWYYEVSKCAPQHALMNLHTGWKNFFRNHKNGTIKKKQALYIKQCATKGRKVNHSKLFNIGKPKFKKKGVHDSFYVEGAIRIVGNRIRIPRMGWLRIEQQVDDLSTIKNVVISRTADHWYVSFKQELTDMTIDGIKSKPSVGVDIGIKTLATLSDGTTFENVKAFNNYRKRLARAQRKASRRLVRGTKVQSNNYYKAQRKVARIHYKISCLRSDSTHKLTSYLAKNHSLIAIEDLDVSEMLQSKRLSNSIADGGFFEFRRQLEYKTKWYGSKLVVIDRWFPSSKTCSTCGNVKKTLSLSERTYKCTKCKTEIDRDLGAAINILSAGSQSVAACGELGVSPSTKQEVNIK